MGLQVGVVECAVDPLRPRLVEGEFALDGVHRVECRRQSRLQRTLMQQGGGEAVQRLDSRAVKMLDAQPAAFSYFVAETGVVGCLFQCGADAVSQFSRSRFGECDGGDPVEGGLAAANEFEDAPDKTGGLAGTRPGLNEQRLVE